MKKIVTCIILFSVLLSTNGNAQQWRGAQIGLLPPKQDVIDLVTLGATLARYQIYYDWDAAKVATCDQYVANVRHYANHLQDNLTGLGIKWIVDLHVPLGGRANNIDIVFSDKTKRDCMAHVWHELATKFKSNKSVLGYDLYNEPLGPHRDISVFMDRLRKVVRAVDKNKVVIVAPYQHSAKHFKHLKVYPRDPKTWYSFHFYDPGNFTHSGVWDKPAGATYKSKNLEVYIANVLSFRSKYPDATIYVGEFGTSIYTDKKSRVRWFRDCTAMFNFYQFNWTFHAWREWEGWSIEGSTPIKSIIEKGFKTR